MSRGRASPSEFREYHGPRGSGSPTSIPRAASVGAPTSPEAW
jgi:hypothetical protein